MIEEHLIKRSIIRFLETRPQILAALGNNVNKIIESQYQSVNSAGYPLIVVDIQNQVPDGTGTDRPKLSRLFFSITVFSEQNSSFECMQLSSLINQVLFNAQIVGTNLNNQEIFRFLRVDLINSVGATMIRDRLWQCENFYESGLHRI